MWERRAGGELRGKRGRERRKLENWRRWLKVADSGPSPRPRHPRDESIRQRGWVRVSMRHLLADYIGIQGRSVVHVVGVVRGILCSQRPWMVRVRGRGTGVGLRPGLGNRRSMNHRAIHVELLRRRECAGGN